ncbi:MAG: CHAP domain-containing protein [Pseudomonadota bacterium]
MKSFIAVLAGSLLLTLSWWSLMPAPKAPRVVVLPAPPLPYKVKAVSLAVPAPGSVAFIEHRGGGRVAVVEAVGENSLTIIEGNYAMGSVTRRTATGKDLADAARQLDIVGYYKP